MGPPACRWRRSRRQGGGPMAGPREPPRYLEILWDVVTWMLVRLSYLGTQLAFGVGRTIAKEAAAGGGLRLILSGSAQVFRAGRGDTPKALGTLGPFRSFGEISILVDLPRTATVVASTPLRCVKLTRTQLGLVEEKEAKLAV